MTKSNNWRTYKPKSIRNLKIEIASLLITKSNLNPKTSLKLRTQKKSPKRLSAKSKLNWRESSLKSKLSNKPANFPKNKRKRNKRDSENFPKRKKSKKDSESFLKKEKNKRD